MTYDFVLAIICCNRNSSSIQIIIRKKCFYVFKLLDTRAIFLFQFKRKIQDEFLIKIRYFLDLGKNSASLKIFKKINFEMKKN